jgi:PHD/YefM family antitoxin component YafN of YafNO toxin-antitoxin module
MRSFSTADLNKHIGAITDAALKEPVYITHHKRPRFVLMNVDDFEALTARPKDQRRALALDELPDELRDGLLALADSYETDNEQR